ncbi:hypothetical protein ACFLUS_04420, partial [Chloroflexota bacterium]
SIRSGSPSHPPEPKETLKRLIIEVNNKKGQLDRYIAATRAGGAQQINEGIIFMTGISQEEMFWDLLSEELNDNNSVIWAEVNHVYKQETLIPTRIISNFGTVHCNHHDFPRNYHEYSKIRKE